MANLFANAFWYEGPATGNQRITGLSAEQALELQKQEDEMKKAEAAKIAAAQADADYNMKAGPALNQEIAGYLKANPTARPTQAPQSDTIKPGQQAGSGVSAFSLGSDSFSQNLSSFASQLQEGSSLGGIPSDNEPGQPMQQQKPQIDTETAYNGMLKGIPVEIAQDLIFQYHNGLIKPKEFLKEVGAVKKSLYDMKVEETKADQVSARKIREQGMQSQGDIDKQYVVGEGQMNLANANNAAALQRQREESASRERIAAMTAGADEKGGRNGDKYSERTFSLKPNQIENLINYDDAQTQISAIKNLYDEAYTGFVKGRVGSIKDFFGALPEKEAAFRSAKQKFDNAMIKLQAGSAVTENEAKRMIKELGDFTKGKEQFSAILNRTSSTIGNSKNVYINGLKKSNYNIGEWGADASPIDLYGGTGVAQKQPAGSATDKIKARAAAGDAKAQEWLKSKGLAW